MRFETMYLQHHGISGQKWGVRRYQNEDGSYTDLGRKHYGIGQSKFGKRRTEDSLTRKTIPVGSTFYRIQKKGTNTLGNQNGGVYVYNKQDQHNLRSIAPWIANTQSISINKLEEVELKTTKPIKVASQEDVNNVMEKLAKDPDIRQKILDNYYFIQKPLIKSDLNKIASGEVTRDDLIKDFQTSADDRLKKTSWFKKLFSDSYPRVRRDLKLSTYDYAAKWADGTIDGVKETVKALDNIGSKKSDDRTLQAGVIGAKDLITRWTASDSEIQRCVYDELRNQGFSAMYDNNMINAGLTNRRFAEAHEPLILLDNSLVEKTGTSEDMTERILGVADRKFNEFISKQDTNL